MTTALSWVVGRGGLLGRHVEASLTATAGRSVLWRPDAPIPWHDVRETTRDLARQATAFLDRAALTAAPWRLLWCAGTGVVATTEEALAHETAVFSALLDTVVGRLSEDPELAAGGVFLFASSAGGIYAGGIPPFDESSPECPVAPYGREKLVQEQRVATVAGTCGLDLLIARYSNLYGPGQNVQKPQGLIAQVGRAALRREPVSIYVPLDTIRDYLFAADAGRMTVGAIERLERARIEGAPPATVTKIFASEVGTTVASVLAVWRQAMHRPLRVALASGPTSALQPRVLSFRSQVWPELRGVPTLLPLGIDAVRRDQLARLLRSGRAYPDRRIDAMSRETG